MSLPGFEERHAPELTEDEKRLAEKIGVVMRAHCFGEKNAQKSEAFGRVYGVKDATFRAMIRYLRRKKHPVCSSGKGYYWASTQQELDACMNHLRSRRNSLDDTLREMEGVRV